MQKMQILLPAGLGELYDKLSILEIKKARITDPERLAFVETEYGELSALAAEHPVTPELYSQLKEVNEALWDIEDEIRKKESRKEFDEGFIELARSVYRQNDKRADIKKKINLDSGSQIVEVKSYTPY